MLTSCLGWFWADFWNHFEVFFWTHFWGNFWTKIQTALNGSALWVTDKHSYVALIPKINLRCGKIEANPFLFFQGSFLAPKFWGHSKTHFDDPKYLEWAKLDQYSSFPSWKRWWGPFLDYWVRTAPKSTHKPPQNSYFEAKSEQRCSRLVCYSGPV